MEFLQKLLDKILEQLSGVDLWIVLSAGLFAAVVWIWSGITKKVEKRVFKRRLIITTVIAFVAILAVFLHNVFSPVDKPFPKEVQGILVLEIKGDDTSNWLQRDLVAALDNQIANDPVEQMLSVRGCHESVNEMNGLDEAYKEARAIGKRLNAKIVVWGDSINGRRFFSHITLTEYSPQMGMRTDRVLAQTIQDATLPPEVVDQPIILAHFALGYSRFQNGNYPAALADFNSAVALRPTEDDDADLVFFRACCHSCLGQGQPDSVNHLKTAKSLFSSIIGVYQKRGRPSQCAKILNNLGVVELSLAQESGNDVTEAIQHFNQALLNLDENQDAISWAHVQNNIGFAYSLLTTGDRKGNFDDAERHLKSALHTFRPERHGREWATVQRNLGILYGSEAVKASASTQQQARDAFEAALTKLTFKDDRIQWAATELSYADALRNTTGTNYVANLKKALDKYRSILPVFTRVAFPSLWASVQDGIADSLCELGVQDSENVVNEAVASYEAAAEVWTRAEYPQKWATEETKIGNALIRLKSDDLTASLTKACICLRAASDVYKSEGRNAESDIVNKTITAAEVERKHFLAESSVTPVISEQKTEPSSTPVDTSNPSSQVWKAVTVLVACPYCGAVTTLILYSPKQWTVCHSCGRSFLAFGP